MQPWKCETNQLILRRVGKLGEELAELLKVTNRIVIQGYDGVDPENNKSNQQALTEEIADVMAQCEVVKKHLTLDERFIKDRIKVKKKQMGEWEWLLQKEKMSDAYQDVLSEVEEKIKEQSLLLEKDPYKPANFQHKEAFCKMKYVCEACGAVEYLWNSRDGVTPFMISCDQQGCDGHMQHKNFSQDRVMFSPDNEINRIFVDMTVEEAKRLAEEGFEKRGRRMMEDWPHLKKLGKEKMIESAFEDFYRDGEAPNIIYVDEWNV